MEIEKPCRKAQDLSNMTPAAARRWQKTKAYKDYKRYRDRQKYRGYTDRVVDRAVSVVRGEARPSTCLKMVKFIKRHRKQSAGEKRFGEGGSKVSAHTAGLRNWLFDPTGRFKKMTEG